MFKYHRLLGNGTSIPPQRAVPLVFLKRRTAYPFFLFRMPDTSFHGPASGVVKPSYIVGSLPVRFDKHAPTTGPFRNPGRPFMLWPIRAEYAIAAALFSRMWMRAQRPS